MSLRHDELVPCFKAGVFGVDVHLAAIEDSKRFDYRHGPAHMAEAQMGELLQRLYPYLFGKDPDVLIFFHYLHLPYFKFAFDRPVCGPARR